MSKNPTKVFHPSVYLKEYLEELEMTQDVFSLSLGISTEQLKLILNEEAPITIDIAQKLSRIIGTSPELWINLQKQYDNYILS